MFKVEDIDRFENWMIKNFPPEEYGLDKYLDEVHDQLGSKYNKASDSDKDAIDRAFRDEWKSISNDFKGDLSDKDFADEYDRLVEDIGPEEALKIVEDEIEKRHEEVERLRELEEEKIALEEERRRAETETEERRIFREVGELGVVEGRVTERAIERRITFTERQIAPPIMTRRALREQIESEIETNEFF